MNNLFHGESLLPWFRLVNRKRKLKLPQSELPHTLLIKVMNRYYLMGVVRVEEINYRTENISIWRPDNG